MGMQFQNRKKTYGMSRFGMYLFMGALYFGLVVVWLGLTIGALYLLEIF